MGRQRLEKEERKRQIKKAAIELITKNGYRNTSVQEIVDRADFSKGGFYNYYSSKNELFKEILSDGMDYSQKRVRNFRLKTGKMDRKTFLVEILLDKILDDNNYKKLFVTFFIEMFNDDGFFDFYNQITNELMPQFMAFCDEEDIGEYKSIVNDEFNVFVTTLILGAEIFNKNNNEKYRNMLREIFRAYFEKKNFIRE